MSISFQILIYASWNQNFTIFIVKNKYIYFFIIHIMGFVISCLFSLQLILYSKLGNISVKE